MAGINNPLPDQDRSLTGLLAVIGDAKAAETRLAQIREAEDAVRRATIEANEARAALEAERQTHAVAREALDAAATTARARDEQLAAREAQIVQAERRIAQADVEHKRRTAAYDASLAALAARSDTLAERERQQQQREAEIAEQRRAAADERAATGAELDAARQLHMRFLRLVQALTSAAEQIGVSIDA